MSDPKEDKVRIKFEESGGGWGNPLLGLVFDSDRDIPDEKQELFKELVTRCQLHKPAPEKPIEKQADSETAEPTRNAKPGPPGPADSKTFELKSEIGTKTHQRKGTFQSEPEEVQELLNFIRANSRKHEFK